MVGNTLTSLRTHDAAQPVAEAVRAAAAAAAARIGKASRAVIFYGSCRRDAAVAGRVVDFYVVVDSYRHAYGRGMMAVANRLLPPNVFFMEFAGGEETVRAKVAVISLAHLSILTSVATFNPTLWARLAQPVRLVWAAGEAEASQVHAALVQATHTLATAVYPLRPPEFTAAEFWCTAFRHTFRAELRSERPERADALYAGDRAFYDEALACLAAEASVPISAAEVAGYRHHASDRRRRRTRLAWHFRRLQGKGLSVLRLMKAAFTFQGGADYIAWKIARHTDVEITLTPWQRRHPILTGLLLFVRLWRRRAFR